MPLYKEGCRITDRNAIKRMHMQGMGVQKIANDLRVKPSIVEMVISGAWDEAETEQTKLKQKLDRERLSGKAKEEHDRIAQIAAAAAQAVQLSTTVTPAVDEAALRKEIEAQVRAELEAEKPKRGRPAKVKVEDRGEAA